MSTLYKDFSSIINADDGKVSTAPVPEPEKPVTFKRNLADIVTRPPQEPDKETPPTDQAPAEKPEEKPADQQPKTEPEVKVVPKAKKPDLDKIVTDKVAEALGSLPAQSQPAKTEPAKQEPAVDPYESTLTEEQKMELDFARYAAQKQPDKYKNLPAQVLGFFKKTEEHIQKHSDDEGRSFDGTDPEFQKFIESNRPKMSPMDRRKLELEQVREIAAAEVEQKHRAEIEKIAAKQRELELRPEIERTVKKFSEETSKFIAEPEQGKEETIANSVMKIANEKGWDEAEKIDPYFAPHVRQIHERAVTVAAEFSALSKGVRQFDATNPVHAFLVKFVSDQERQFDKVAGDAKVRVGDDGTARQFISRSKLAEIASKDPAKAAQYWTLSDYDILVQLAHSAKISAENKVNAEAKRLEAAGFKREKKQATAKEAPKQETPPAKREESPKVTPSVSPGAASAGQKPVNPLVSSIFSGIGMPIK